MKYIGELGNFAFLFWAIPFVMLSLGLIMTFVYSGLIPAINQRKPALSVNTLVA